MRPRPHRRARVAVATFAACLCAAGALASEDDRAAGRGNPAAREEQIGPADFAILITVHLTAAEMNCPYRIEEGRVRRLLRHHGLTLGEAYTASRSAQLKREVDKVLDGFRTDWETACAIAWKHFGPGATFEGFLQPR